MVADAEADPIYICAHCSDRSFTILLFPVSYIADSLSILHQDV